MRQSLATNAITGVVHPKTGDAIVPIGFRNPRPGENGRQPIYPIMGASPDDDPDNSGGGDDNGDDDGNKGGGGDDPAGGGDDPENKRDPRVKELSDENAKWRNRAKEAEKARDEAAARLKEIDDADKSELDKATGRVTELETEVASKDKTIADLLIQNAFLTSNTYDWKNPATALKLVDLSEVELEDGKVVGLDKALKALATSDAYLLKDGDDEDDKPDPATGKPPAKKKTGNPDRDKLTGKYPALRR